MPSIFVAAPGIDTSSDAVVSEPVRTLAYEGVTDDVMERKNAIAGAGTIALHVLAITLLANLGKMFPVFCYRREATLRERLALSVAMFPRGEVGAGVLVISLGYGLGGTPLTIAVLSLALNLLCTGFFILAVKRLLNSSGKALEGTPQYR